MAALTIRNLDETLKRDLRKRAAANDRSMEEEARVILREAVGAQSKGTSPGYGLGTELRKLFEPLGGVEMELPPRGPARPLPDMFEDE